MRRARSAPSTGESSPHLRPPIRPWTPTHRPGWIAAIPRRTAATSELTDACARPPTEMRRGLSSAERRSPQRPLHPLLQPQDVFSAGDNVQRMGIAPVLPAHRERRQVAVGDWSGGRKKKDASQNLACAAEMVPRVFARSRKRPLALGIAMLVVAAVPICGDDGGIEVCIAPICPVAQPSLAEIRRLSPVKQGEGQDSLAPLQR